MLPSCESSYGWSNKDRDGWSERFYYTYYTSLGERDVLAQFGESFLFAVILLLSLLANVTIIVSVIRRKDMQNVTKCFIVNLAIADLVFALGIPAIVTARVSPSWILGGATCKLLPYSQFVCGSVLLWTLAAISLDRVQCLAKAPYRSGLTQKTATVIIVAAWIIALIVFLPVALFFREQEVKHINASLSDDDSDIVTVCTLVFPPSRTLNSSLIFTMLIVLISCVVPMAVLLVNFIVIARKLSTIQTKLEERTGSVQQFNKLRFSLNFVNRLSQEIKTSDSSIENSLSSPREPKNHQSPMSSLNRLKKHKRAVRILFTNTFAVLAMWLPITIVMFLIYADGHRSNSNFFLSNQYFIWTVVLALMNTIINPIIYGFLTEHRKGDLSLKNLCKKKFCIWSDATDSDNKHSSSQGVRNLTIKNYNVDNPNQVETR